MSTPAIDPTTSAFLAHLRRGGSYAYFWGASEAKNERNQPVKKQTWWYPVDRPAPLPPERTGYGPMHLYVGIHPVAAIPEERRNSKGEVYKPKPASVRPYASEVAAINCLFAEFDFKSYASPEDCIAHINQLLPPPSARVLSGGGVHCYWFLASPYLLDTEERRARAAAAQADFVKKVGGEKESKDLARVLRLPGSHNYKAAYGPDYPEVRFDKVDFALLYVLDDLVERRSPRAQVVNAWDRYDGTDDEVAKADRALSRLSLARCDNYAEWMAVGMSLRSLGLEGLRLWDAWSRRSPKYHAGLCDEKWADITREVRGLGIGSLYAWAKQDDPGGEPRKIRPLERSVRPVVALEPPHPATDPLPSAVPARPLTVDQARALLVQEVNAYLETPLPTEVLVLAFPPGLGKSHTSVAAIEELARKHKRGIYCAPRKDFFVDVARASRKINANDGTTEQLWYAWEGRTAEREDGTTPCLYPEAMTTWLARGHGALGLCASRLCGWRYVSGPNACAYHRQKTTDRPIIFAQHAHAVLGHPLMETVSVVIGDENPLETFTHLWRIPRRWIVPKNLDPQDALADLLNELQRISQRIEAGDIEKSVLSGPALLSELGGPEAVLAACTNPAIDDEAPRIFAEYEVNSVDYNHTPALAALLRAEATEALAGRSCLERVIVNADGLLLLRGYRAADTLPPHVIWLDATANEAVYRELFWPRPVRVVRPQVEFKGRVHVVADRSWSKTSLVRDDAAGDAQLVKDKSGQERAQQLQELISHIVTTRAYTSPAIVTYKDLGDALLADLPGGKLHFYGSRGSNALEHCDALIVAGTPQLSRQGLITLAKMVFKRRLRPFDEAWEEVDRAYHGIVDAEGRQLAYPVSTFSRDADLAALHWQLCEAELIQALHRARPLLRDVDVWLLSSRPLDGVPVHKLWSLRELFEAPLGVDVWLWRRVWSWAQQRYAETSEGDIAFSTRDIAATFNVVPAAAGKYLDLLVAQLPEAEETRAVVKGRGQPPRALRRLS